jgi:hypothetical protein
MTHAEAIRALETIKSESLAFDSNWEILCDVLHCSPESPIHEGFFKMQNLALDGFADKSGIHSDAVHWFVYENLWGAKGLIAKQNNGEPIVIGSVDTFVRFEMAWTSAQDVTK